MMFALANPASQPARQYDADNFWDFRLEDLKFLLQQCLQDRKRVKMLGLEEDKQQTCLDSILSTVDRVLPLFLHEVSSFDLFCPFRFSL